MPDTTAPPGGAIRLGHGDFGRQLVMETGSVVLEVLPDHGGDIHRLQDPKTGIDVLLRAPDPPLLSPGADSHQSWAAAYLGGWQTILPNFGPATKVDGQHLDFHGEAARRRWSVVDYRLDDDALVAVLTVTLRSVPVQVVRELRLLTRRPTLLVRERVTNLVDRDLELMWGHHPVIGPPLLSPAARIHTSAEVAIPDTGFTTPANDLLRASPQRWPAVQSDDAVIDLSRVPPSGAGISRVVTLTGFATAWLAVTNPELSLGFALAWDHTVFPYACLWYEVGGDPAPPWHRRGYALGLEPHSSYPGHGLAQVRRTTQTQLRLSARSSRVVRLAATIFVPGTTVASVSLDGKVQVT